MPVDLLVPEDDLRSALRPYRVAPDAFEAAVRERLQVAERMRVDQPLAGLSPMWRAAAALLPLQIFAGCRVKGATAQLVPATGFYKLLSYLAFPAISFFVLLGATSFSVAKIRGMQYPQGLAGDDEEAMREGLRQWWRDHKRGAILVYVATLALPLIGATWLLFLFYIISFGLLLFVLTSFAKLGLGNRRMIGLSCVMGLVLLAQVTMIPQIGVQEIHFVDPGLVTPIFLGGALLLAPFVILGSSVARFPVEKTPRWMYAITPIQLLVALGVWWIFPNVWILAPLVACAFVPLALNVYRSRNAGQLMTTVQQRTLGGLFAILVIPLIVWLLSPILWPATPQRIKNYVESFDKAPFESFNWQRWEIVARWAIERKLDPDLSNARRLLDVEIAGKQNPFILASAFRVGLVGIDQINQLHNYEKRLRLLLDARRSRRETRPIPSLEQEVWVIRAAVLRNDLSEADCDYLAKRLHATIAALSTSPYEVLETALRASQLLQTIGRPIDRDQYRDQIHDYLKKSHSIKGGGFQPAGGFKPYLNSQVGAVDATSNAVELMEIYGIPHDLDLNWVRSYLRPGAHKLSDEKWIAAVTLDRLNHLPGAPQSTWLETFYYERSLIAAMVLVGLCIYATARSPQPRATESADE